MDFIDGNGTAKQVTTYVEKDVSESKKITEKELSHGVAPAAKAAFNRKPYDYSSNLGLKKPSCIIKISKTN